MTDDFGEWDVAEVPYWDGFEAGLLLGLGLMLIFFGLWLKSFRVVVCGVVSILISCYFVKTWKETFKEG